MRNKWAVVKPVEISRTSNVPVSRKVGQRGELLARYRFSEIESRDLYQAYDTDSGL